MCVLLSWPWHLQLSPTCVDKCCHGFRAGKQLVDPFLHYMNCRLNPNSKPGISKLRPTGQMRLVKPFPLAGEAILSMMKNNILTKNFWFGWVHPFQKQSHYVRCPALKPLIRLSHFCQVRVTSPSSQSHLKNFWFESELSHDLVESSHLWVIGLQARVKWNFTFFPMTLLWNGVQHGMKCRSISRGGQPILY